MRSSQAELAAASAEVQTELARGVELSTKAEATEEELRAAREARSAATEQELERIRAEQETLVVGVRGREGPPRRRARRRPGGRLGQARPRGGPARQSGTPGQPDREADRGRGARALRRAAVRRRGRPAWRRSRPSCVTSRWRRRCTTCRRSVPAADAAAVDAVDPQRSAGGSPLVHAVHEGARARREEVALAHPGADPDHEVQEGLEGPDAADQAAHGRGAAPGPHGRRPRRGRRARPRRRGPHDQADRPRSVAEARRRRVRHRRRSRRPCRQPAARGRRRLAPRRTGDRRPAPVLRRPHGDRQGHHGPAGAAWTAAR